MRLSVETSIIDTLWPAQEKAFFQEQYFGQRHGELAHVKVSFNCYLHKLFFSWRKQLPTWCSNFSTDKTRLCSGRNFCRQIAQPTLLVNMGRKACRRKTGKPTMVSAPEVGEGAVSSRHTDSKNTVVCSWSKECSRFESFLEPVATCGV